MLKRILKNEKGLTLIELLAVVVILGIIAAIAVPAIGKIIDDSRNKAVVSDALQIINAAKIAKAANPTVDSFTGNGTPTDDDNADLDNYLDTKLKTEVTVTFSSGSVTIGGHEVTDATDGIGDFAGDDTATEKDLVEYLEGE